MSSELGEYIWIWQQRDGMWRWQWVPSQEDSGEASPLVSFQAFDSLSEARESAQEAYPGLPMQMPGPSPAQRRLKRRRLMIAAATTTVVVVAVRRRRRHRHDEQAAEPVRTRLPRFVPVPVSIEVRRAVPRGRGWEQSVELRVSQAQEALRSGWRSSRDWLQARGADASARLQQRRAKQHQWRERIVRR